MSVNGFALIDKESDWTSRDVCNKLGHIFSCKKVGHIGTLDPFATGLLVVAFGEGTKCLPYISDDKKTYIATLKLGEETSSGDLTGEVISHKEIPSLSKTNVLKTLKSFLGQQEQVPPMSSAIHYKGQKLYSLYRQGIKVDIPPKKIEIYDIDLISFENNQICFKTTVSKGTYIRVLGEDIAKKLGTVGHLVELRRTKINDISVEHALKINEIQENSLIPLKELMSHFVAIVILNKEQENKAIHGMEMNLDFNEDKIMVVSSLGQPIAFYGKIKKGKYTCLRGFNFGNN